jgi:hypothetical protein
VADRRPLVGGRSGSDAVVSSSTKPPSPSGADTATSGRARPTSSASVRVGWDSRLHACYVHRRAVLIDWTYMSESEAAVFVIYCRLLAYIPPKTRLIS